MISPDGDAIPRVRRPGRSDKQGRFLKRRNPWAVGNSADSQRKKGNVLKPVIKRAGFLGGYLAPFALLLFHAGAAGAQTWDAAKQFDPVNNPAQQSPWSYGFTSSVGSGDFTPLPYHTPLGNLPFEFWLRANPNVGFPEDYPGVFYNATPDIQYLYNAGDPQLGVNGSVAPGQLVMAPDYTSAVVSVRWQAPFAATYQIAGIFAAVQQQGLRGPSANVFILKNNAVVFSSGCYGGYATTGWSGVVTLSKNDVIDFGIDHGNDGYPDSDTIGIDAKITNLSAPEPGSLALITLTALAFGIRLLRSRRSG